MPKQTPLMNSFNAGELSPKIDVRSDIQKYYNGCRTMENFFPLVEGGAQRVPGTYYVAEVKLVPSYSISLSQSPSASISSTPSASVSPSASLSPTPSSSVSPSSSISPSASISLSPSLSPSASISASVSPSPG